VRSIIGYSRQLSFSFIDRCLNLEAETAYSSILPARNAAKSRARVTLTRESIDANDSRRYTKLSFKDVGGSKVSGSLDAGTWDCTHPDAWIWDKKQTPNCAGVAP